MGSPVQTQIVDSQERPYVLLTWAEDYWPEVYANYPRQLFPTEKAALAFGAGSVSECTDKRIVRAEVYSKDSILLDIFGE